MRLLQKYCAAHEERAFFCSLMTWHTLARHMPTTLKVTQFASVLVICFLALATGVFADQHSDLIEASVHEFKIEIPDIVLEDLKLRLDRIRWPDQLTDVKDWSLGTEKKYLKDLMSYWRNSYDWREEEKKLNAVPQFYSIIDGLKIHFIHVKSPRTASSRIPSIPLLMLHGWPGSFYECLKLLPRLVDPGNESEPAFDVVCPSLPGFGFSDAPPVKGYHHKKLASLMSKLMSRLGYQYYIVQGGSWGAVVATAMAAADPKHIRGLHVNFVLSPSPNQKGFWPLLKSMSTYLIPRKWNPFTSTGALDNVYDNFQWIWKDGAFIHLQGTKPQTIGYALSDSPVGLAAWIVEKYHDWSDRNALDQIPFSKDDMLTNIMVYYITNSITSSMRFFYEVFQLDFFSSSASEDFYVSQPTGVALFPREILKSPRQWVDHYYNVLTWTAMDRGGHFPALEAPELLISDIRNYVRKLSALEVPKLTDREL